MFPVDRMSEIKDCPDDFKLVERVPLRQDDLPMALSGDNDDVDPPGAEPCPIVLLDTETTGMTDKDKIIELGMVKAVADRKTGRLLRLIDGVSLFEDPGIEIPEEATRIHGITNAMVEGHAIRNSIVEEWLNDDPLVIAHNASFDRPFVGRRFVASRMSRWACSMKEAPWRTRGFEGAKLEYLLLKQGYFYEGHRAVMDCLAMAWLFHLQPWALKAILDSSDMRFFRIRALEAPFSVKKQLSDRDYRWNDGSDGQPRAWYKDVPDNKVDAERSFLRRLYPSGAQKASFTPFGARQRYAPWSS